MTQTTQTRAGDLLRTWRQRRRLSQLELAMQAEISQRHLSFVESGRSSPSRDMILLLAEQLSIPLRERNALLVSAGFAPVYRERPLGDPELAPARAAVDLVLKGQEPLPALAVDRHWNLVAMNAAAPVLMTGLPASLLTPPLNVLKVSMHPDGLAPRIENYEQWRAHVFMRLAQQIDASFDPKLAALLDELRSYPKPRPAPARAPRAQLDMGSVAVPFQLRTEHGLLSFISTTTVFGTPVDITLSELAIEQFFPADEATTRILRSLFRTNV